MRIPRKLMVQLQLLLLLFPGLLLSMVLLKRYTDVVMLRQKSRVYYVVIFFTVTVGLGSSRSDIVKHIFLVKFDFIIQYGSFRGLYNDYSDHTIFRYHFYRTLSK
jgi:hypothetical protein